LKTSTPVVELTAPFTTKLVSAARRLDAVNVSAADEPAAAGLHAAEHQRTDVPQTRVMFQVKCIIAAD
jgi:hypothetical protein